MIDSSLFGTWSKAMSSYFGPEDVVSFLACCATIGFVYKALERTVQTEKGRAWIVMLISSAVLSLFGTTYVLNAHTQNLWNSEYIYGEDKISRMVLVFFLASNVMDLVLGLYHYPKFLDPFSTIAHHVFYIAFISVLLSHHYSRGFMLCFFMEVPTFVLSLGTIWPNLRSDAMFGLTFVITRLLYNIYLATTLYYISPEGTIWKICFAVLGLHTYWFSKWSNKQGKDLVNYYFGLETKHMDKSDIQDLCRP